MKRSNSKKYLFISVVVMLLVLAGCGNKEERGEKESTTVSNTAVDQYRESDTEHKSDLLASIYEKLSDSDKEMIVDLSEAVISTVVLENDKGVKKVNESAEMIGKKIYKAEYKTDDETLEEVIVYADMEDLSILGYGLVD